MTFLLFTALTVMRIITVPLRNTQTDKARQKKWWEESKASFGDTLLNRYEAKCDMFQKSV